MGGFCKFWYIPVEDIAVFPRVSASSQKLVDEPLLVNGAGWFGPIEVPRDKLGFSELMQSSKAGPSYTTKLEGLHVGDSAESRVNLENMPYHRYVVVGKVRAGGFCIIIGTPRSWCNFLPEYKSGNSTTETAGTSFSFITNHISKPYILPAFLADTISSGIGVEGSGGASTMNKSETIFFENQGMVNIPWTATRQEKFGSFPIVEVWIQELGQKPFLSFGGNIEVDHPPPAFSELSVKLGGAASGFIILK